MCLAFGLDAVEPLDLFWFTDVVGGLGEVPPVL